MEPRQNRKTACFFSRHRAGWLVYAACAAAFLPVLTWIARRALAHDQLFSAFILLGFAGIMLAAEHRRHLKPAMRFRPACFYLLLLSYGLLAAAKWYHLPPLVIISACCAAGSFLLYLFGPSIARPAAAFLAAFGVFACFSLIMPRFDWPLRALAGRNAAWIFHQLGCQPLLALAVTAQGPHLLLLVKGRSYTVAPECNGFGLILSCLLLAVLMSLAKKIKWPDKILLAVLAVLLAFFLNILRIVIIILLAPAVGEASYRLMHEIAGTLIFWFGLGLLWWFIAGFGNKLSGSAGNAQ